MSDRQPESRPKTTRFRTIPPVVLPQGAEFSGLVVLPESARIDGQVTGDVIASGLVWIGKTARVVARIEAEAVVIEGSVEGSIEARDRVDLFATARVLGEIQTRRLTLADGSFLRGRCRAGAGGADPPGSS